MSNTVYIGIGTNIGDRVGNIENALSAINKLPNTKVTGVSAIYETEPWGYTQQDNFYNICAKIETDFTPNGMLGACLGIEAAFGRERPFKNAPRVIDIDILLYNDLYLETDELTVPHPRMMERAFVLVPLKDILPSMAIGDYNFNSAYEKCDKTGVYRKNNVQNYGE